MILHFTQENLSCRCGCGAMPQPELVNLANRVYAEYGRPLRATNAMRCARYTKSLRKRGILAAYGSAHNVGLALDLIPEDGDLKAFHEFCISKLERWDAYMEDPAETPKHAHLQLRKASARVFKLRHMPRAV